MHQFVPSIVRWRLKRTYVFDIEAEKLCALRDVGEELLHELLACRHEGVTGQGLCKTLHLRARMMTVYTGMSS